MNIDHYKDPRSYVQETVDYARIELQRLKVPDRIIDGIRYTIEDGAGYECAVLRRVKMKNPHGIEFYDVELHEDAWLLLEVHAAGTAYLSGPNAGSQAVRFEFERVCQQWNNLCDERMKLKFDQSRRGRQPCKKVHDRNVWWTLEAYRLVAAEKKLPCEVASFIAKNKKINPDGRSKRTIREALKEHGFYQ